MTCNVWIVAGVLALASPLGAQAAGERPSAGLALAFEPNVGQTDERVRFVSRGPGFTLFLTDHGAVLSLPGAASERPVPDVLRLSLDGAGETRDRVRAGPVSGRSHYFLGADPAGWHVDVPRHESVAFGGVYPGIDLVYYGNPDRLELDFVVAPGADPGAIRLRLEGQERAEIGAGGELSLRLAASDVVLGAPFAYQDGPAGRRTVEARYTVGGDGDGEGDGSGLVGFEVGAFDPALPLVIDPVLYPILHYSTFLGGSDAESGRGVATVGRSAVVTGWTASVDFPVEGSLQPPPGGDFDVFVARLNDTGTHLSYATYLGGSGDDFGADVAVAAGGEVFVAGSTTSSDFPVSGAPQPGYGGVRDAFVAKLSANGARLVYATYLGGGAFDVGLGIALDGGSRAYVCGHTLSTDFPTANALQPVYGGGAGPVGGDAFVSVLDSTGANLDFSSFFGGSDNEQGRDVAVDAAGNFVLVGTTPSDDLQLMNAFQPMRAGGLDAFVTVFAAGGTGLLYSTYVGGTDRDFASGVCTDPNGNVYVVGDTSSVDFPVSAAVQPTLSGPCDAFVTVVKPGGIPGFSTYLGGSDLDLGMRCALDQQMNVLIAGETFSADFPVRFPVQRRFAGGSSDGFVTRLTPQGALAYSSYLGGNGFEFAAGIAVDADGHAIVVGDAAASTNFPIVHPVQPDFGGGPTDAFVSKMCVDYKGCLDFFGARRSPGPDGSAVVNPVRVRQLLRVLRAGGSPLDAP